ncbi:MAG: hypothetical protein SF097_10515 [Acidobacteriota bacterium]|nr:hypothetical protein [Acidobacteriota bacterium]
MTGLTDFQVLDTVRNEIQAEHNLISHRLTWYVTSQSFLVASYALSWSKEYGWPSFFHSAIPTLGLLLSMLTLLSVACAVVVQWKVINKQAEILDEIEIRLTEAQDIEGIKRVRNYGAITGKKRKRGKLTHWLAMIPPLLIPIIFASTWIVALKLNGK